MLTLEQLQTQHPALKQMDFFSITTITSPEEVAALILHVNRNAHEIEDMMDSPEWCRGASRSAFALQEEGSITRLFTTNPDIAWAGLAIVMDSISDPRSLMIEDMAFLLAAATPGSAKHTTPAMAEIFLKYTEKLVRQMELDAKTQKPKKSLRTLPYDIVYVQNALDWLDGYLTNRKKSPEIGALKECAIDVAQRFTQYIPPADIPMPLILETAWNVLYKHGGIDVGASSSVAGAVPEAKL